MERHRRKLLERSMGFQTTTVLVAPGFCFATRLVTHSDLHPAVEDEVASGQVEPRSAYIEAEGYQGEEANEEEARREEEERIPWEREDRFCFKKAEDINKEVSTELRAAVLA